MPCPEMEDNYHTFLIGGHVSPGNFFIEIKRVPLFPLNLSEICIKPIEQHHCGLGHGVSEHVHFPIKGEGKGTVV